MILPFCSIWFCNLTHFVARSARLNKLACRKAAAATNWYTVFQKKTVEKNHELIMFITVQLYKKAPAPRRSKSIHKLSIRMWIHIIQKQCFTPTSNRHLLITRTQSNTIHSIREILNHSYRLTPKLVPVSSISKIGSGWKFYLPRNPIEQFNLITHTPTPGNHKLIHTFLVIERRAFTVLRRVEETWFLLVGGGVGYGPWDRCEEFALGPWPGLGFGLIFD